MGKTLIRGKHLYLLLEVLEELHGEAIGMTNANERLRPIDEIRKVLVQHGVDGAKIGKGLSDDRAAYRLMRLFKKIFESNPTLMEVDLEILPVFLFTQQIESLGTLLLFFASPAFKEEDFLLPVGATP